MSGGRATDASIGDASTADAEASRHGLPPGPEPADPTEWATETAALYAAEDRLIRWIEDGSVRLDGMTWLPEPDPLFRDVREVARFCDAACDRLGVPRVDVRARKGPTRAEYRAPLMEIAVPTAEVGGAWALRGLIVVHELAHHLVAVGGTQQGGPHGESFRLRMTHALEVLGFPGQGRLLGLALATDHAPAEQTVWRERIAAILRQAEATTHRAEAETFVSRAQELATRHAIDLALLQARDRAAGEAAQGAELPEEQSVVIGRPGQRWLRLYCSLFMAVARANDVEFLLARDSTRMYAHGMPSDIAMTVALYESLRAQMVAAGTRWMATGAWKQTTTRRRNGRRVEEVPVHWSTAKTSFYEGFVVSIAERLDESRRRAEEQADRAVSTGAGVPPPADPAGTHSTALHSTAIVLAAKREQVRAFHQQVVDRIRPGRWRGNDRGPSAWSESGARAGREAGQRAAVGRARGELLGPPGERRR
ncbi:DUF2786 domain-containing protein [Raineyella sp. LH-20]|uniref:DUF7168 domain-containing protein n=1 Tax=Raineyella sp. LH-20 TaxID=3081204 RepID=UPI00295372AD|nr:DUF2786 domain-containing protein [Raineyella sp. LH-20]WOP17463.1 DUF2786 domain-containing protein [Raineyella sp. LH-20]